MIYVVDDDPMNLRMAEFILGKYGKTVTKISSGKELLSAVRNSVPHLVLLDINMPEMDGFETLENLKKLEAELGIADIPVIFLTAEEDIDTENRGFKMGVSDYIRKPFEPEILIRRIENILGKQEKIQYFREEAIRDKLTGLYNKAYINERMDDLIRRTEGCFFMIDLDSFKLVNDLYGHEMGDRILKAFSDLLKEQIPEESTIGRIGGDEFVAFSTGVSSEDEVEKIAGRLNRGIVREAKELMGENMGIALGVSMGAVFTVPGERSFEEVFKLADKTLYKVKNNGKHGIMVYKADSAEDEEDDEFIDLNMLNTLLSERNIPDSAFMLDQASFLHVYRFVTRYIMRYQKNACKLLFTLRPAGDSVHYEEYCDEFCEHAKKHLRKSDLLMQYKRNQLFVFLTEVKEDGAENVVNHIVSSWKAEKGEVLSVSWETQFMETSKG